VDPIKYSSMESANANQVLSSFKIFANAALTTKLTTLNSINADAVLGTPSCLAPLIVYKSSANKMKSTLIPRKLVCASLATTWLKEFVEDAITMKFMMDKPNHVPLLLTQPVVTTSTSMSAAASVSQDMFELEVSV